MKQEIDVAGENLQLLLGSKDNENIHLGLELAMSREIPILDFTNVVGIALFHRLEPLRSAAMDLLQARSSKDLRVALQHKWEPTYAEGDSKVFFQAVQDIGKHPELSLSRLQRLAVQHTTQFPRGQAHKYPHAFLAHCDGLRTISGELDLSNLYIPFWPSEFEEWERNNRLRNLNIRYTKLRRLPDYIGNFDELEELEISGNTLKSLPKSMSKLKKLKFLWAINNQITTFPESFSQLKSLLVFDIALNPIRTFPAFIAELPNLRLQRFNVRAETDYSALSSCTNLPALQLYSIKKHAKFPEGITALHQLEVLKIHAKDYPHPLPTELDRLPALTEVELELDNSMEMPAFVQNLSQMTYLDFKGVGKIPKKLPPANLPKLEILDLADLEWPDWPRDWCNLPSIKLLEIVRAKFTSLPPEFSQLQSLGGLTIKSVPLEAFPPAIPELSNLSFIRLHNTNITELPEDLDRLHNLTSLEFSGSELRDLPDALFRMKRLETIKFWNVKLNVQQIKALTVALPNTSVMWS